MLTWRGECQKCVGASSDFDYGVSEVCERAKEFVPQLPGLHALCLFPRPPALEEDWGPVVALQCLCGAEQYFALGALDVQFDEADRRLMSSVSSRVIRTLRAGGRSFPVSRLTPFPPPSTERT